jgi:hypothetical protein
MTGESQVAFWITTPDPTGPLGFGVTARTREEAFALLRAEGYAVEAGAPGVEVREGVTAGELAALAHSTVLRHMGPIVVRGVWYPPLNLRGRPQLDWRA